MGLWLWEPGGERMSGWVACRTEAAASAVVGPGSLLRPSELCFGKLGIYIVRSCGGVEVRGSG